MYRRTESASPPAGMAEASAKFEHEAAGKAAPMSERDMLSMVTKSAEAGNENAQHMVEQADSWRQLPFVREENGNAVIEWPPVSVKGESKDLMYGALCTLGTRCALDLIGHLRNNGKAFDGGDLSRVARAIVERGEFTGLEIGFFNTLGDFIAWGYTKASADFDAVLLKDREAPS